MDARKTIIEKLSEQDDVEKVLKVFVNKNESLWDINNFICNSVDIVLSTKQSVNVWEKKMFKKNIFSK